MSQKRKYRLVYFKAWNGPRGVGGKYYSEGEYETGSSWHDMLDEVETLQQKRRLPGLSAPHSAYHVLVDGEVPHLLLSENVVREVDAQSTSEGMTVSLPTPEGEEPLTEVEQAALADQVKAVVEQTLLRLFEMRKQKRRRNSIVITFTAQKGDE